MIFSWWLRTALEAGINGIGLSMVIPSGQSMVADYYPEERRGAAFGALYLTGALGAMLGRLCPSTSLLQGRWLIASLWVSKRASC